MVDDDLRTSGLLPPIEDVRALLGIAEGKAVPRLHVLLTACSPRAALEDQLDALETLGRFIVDGPNMITDGDPDLARLALLVDFIEKVPEARGRFTGTVKSVLSQTRAIKLLGEVGLPNDRGLLAETADRLARRFLPEAPAPKELVWLAGRIIRTQADLDWLVPAADPLLHRLAALGCWEGLRPYVIDAISMLTTRIAAHGMTEEFRTRTAVTGVRDSPLYHLARARPMEMPALIEACRRHLDQVRIALEHRGVNVEVVYALDAIERGLERIEILLPFVSGEDELEPTYEIRAVIAACGHGLAGARSFRHVVGDNLRLLARKVIERAGRTGEHYVTSSRAAWFAMLRSAWGGGFLTVGTIVVKFLIKWQDLAPFFDGLLSSVDYAASFVLMQLLGWTLATKQPSMTAASLAGAIRERAGPGQTDELVPMIAQIARSQFAAALGNVSMVIVVALATDFVFAHVLGHHFIDPADAKATIESYDPFGSGTIPFAAITGVLLWLSSLFAGWFENWVVYRRLPEGIEYRWGPVLGQARMTKLRHFMEHEAAGLGGSVALGFLLGTLPVFAKFFGLPIDTRHITLSTGSLTFALSSIGVSGIGWGLFVKAWIGIVFIGLLNFGVSFGLALIVALRARDVESRERLGLPRIVLRQLVRHPLQFFFPPREPKPGVPAGEP